MSGSPGPWNPSLCSDLGIWGMEVGMGVGNIGKAKGVLRGEGPHHSIHLWPCQEDPC